MTNQILPSWCDGGKHQEGLDDRVRRVVSSPGTDEISAFYESHPYPPPVADLSAYVDRWRDGARRRVEHHRMWPTLAYRDDHTVLVAGCGTAQAAAVAVLNQAHTDPDLVLFLDALEKAEFDAIDGRRTIAQITDRGVALFERLWRHDHIVIDASDGGPKR